MSKEIETVDSDNAFNKGNYEGNESEFWDWVWGWECVRLLGIFRMGEFSSK